MNNTKAVSKQNTLSFDKLKTRATFHLADIEQINCENLPIFCKKFLIMLNSFKIYRKVNKKHYFTSFSSIFHSNNCAMMAETTTKTGTTEMGQIWLYKYAPIPKEGPKHQSSSKARQTAAKKNLPS